jgi:hypothetical protein
MKLFVSRSLFVWVARSAFLIDAPVVLKWIAKVSTASPVGEVRAVFPATP